jgi:hypothetical protein
MKVVELKALLAARGLDTKGVKSVLVRRLKAALADDRAVPATGEDITPLDGQVGSVGVDGEGVVSMCNIVAGSDGDETGGNAEVAGSNAAMEVDNDGASSGGKNASNRDSSDTGDGTMSLSALKEVTRHGALGV